MTLSANERTTEIPDDAIRSGVANASVFELLRGRPALVDGLLMARGIRTDVLRLLHGNREVDAQVTVEIVVGEVLRGVRHVVGRADVGLAIREGDPDRLRRPRRLAAERLEHDGRILRRGGLGVHMRVLGHNAQLPGVAGGEIIHRAVFAVGVVSLDANAVVSPMHRIPKAATAKRIVLGATVKNCFFRLIHRKRRIIFFMRFSLLVSRNSK